MGNHRRRAKTYDHCRDSKKGKKSGSSCGAFCDACQKRAAEGSLFRGSASGIHFLCFASTATGIEIGSPYFVSACRTSTMETETEIGFAGSAFRTSTTGTEIDFRAAFQETEIGIGFVRPSTEIGFLACTLTMETETGIGFHVCTSTIETGTEIGFLASAFRT